MGISCFVNWAPILQVLGFYKGGKKIPTYKRSTDLSTNPMDLIRRVQNTSEVKLRNIIRVAYMSQTGCIHPENINQWCEMAFSASRFSPSRRREILSPHHVCWLLPTTGLLNQAASVSSVNKKKGKRGKKKGFSAEHIAIFWLSVPQRCWLPDPTICSQTQERWLLVLEGNWQESACHKLISPRLISSTELPIFLIHCCILFRIQLAATVTLQSISFFQVLCEMTNTNLFFPAPYPVLLSLTPP